MFLDYYCIVKIVGFLKLVRPGTEFLLLLTNLPSDTTFFLLELVKRVTP